MIRHLIISDLHVPDHNIQALKLLHKFISDFKPDTLHILGDFVNFNKISRYNQDARDKINLVDEVEQGYAILRTLTEHTKKANKKAEVIWYFGNHDESRLEKYLSKNAPQLADLKEDEEYLLSIPTLFDLKKLGVKWVRDDEFKLIGDVVLTHGDKVRAKSGYTAHAMLEKYGMSGVSGHTHRLSFVSKTQLGKTKYWIENGCLCNQEVKYTLSPDWQLGFSVIIEDKGKTYPTIIPIQDGKFVYNGKVYEN